MRNRTHIDYFDHLRLLAAFSVIYMHAASSSLRGEIHISWHITNFFTGIAFTAVPLFFMMSGYLLLSDSKTADVDVLLKRRLPRLIVPLLGWTVVAILWELFLARQLSPLLFLDRLIQALSRPQRFIFGIFIR